MNNKLSILSIIMMFGFSVSAFAAEKVDLTKAQIKAAVAAYIAAHPQNYPSLEDSSQTSSIKSGKREDALKKKITKGCMKNGALTQSNEPICEDSNFKKIMTGNYSFVETDIEQGETIKFFFAVDNKSGAVTPLFSELRE